jgi:predicted GNAT family acetyltransferase
MTDDTLVVHHDVDGRRYELHRGDQLIGFADYVAHDDVIVIPHVETLVEHRGNGFAAVLMAGIVDDVRASGRRIRPVCPYAAQYLLDRPATLDVVVD